jgi:ADP-ribose pyrophosphatase YjhB (NUDIX family)
MECLMKNAVFWADYERLKGVQLNPARHAAANAYEHCEFVATRVSHLAAQNGCTPEEAQLLQNLAHAHDIGKVAGTANPEASVELLSRYGITDARFIDLVKYHDTNLPWYMAAERGQPPSDKAWRKLAGKVNVRLLCLFMVADRADCPGGWRTNRPLVWFLKTARERGLLSEELILDDGPSAPQAGGPAVETSSGAALVRETPSGPEVLVIKLRSAGYELPKGHLEWNETLEVAAARELKEETGLLSELVVSELLGTLEYAFEADGVVVQKRVTYYRCTAASSGALAFGGRPPRTKEVRWVTLAEVPQLLLVSEELRPILTNALSMPGRHPLPGNIVEGPGS